MPRSAYGYPASSTVIRSNPADSPTRRAAARPPRNAHRIFADAMSPSRASVGGAGGWASCQTASAKPRSDTSEAIVDHRVCRRVRRTVQDVRRAEPAVQPAPRRRFGRPCAVVSRRPVLSSPGRRRMTSLWLPDTVESGGYRCRAGHRGYRRARCSMSAVAAWSWSYVAPQPSQRTSADW